MINGGFNIGVGPQIILSVIKVKVVILTPETIPEVFILISRYSSEGCIVIAQKIYSTVE